MLPAGFGDVIVLLSAKRGYCRLLPTQPIDESVWEKQQSTLECVALGDAAGEWFLLDWVVCR
jgi:hypothetical protein